MTNKEQAIRYFKERGLHAYDGQDGYVYLEIEAYGKDKDGYVTTWQHEVAISEAEVKYRAEVYREVEGVEI